MRDLLTAGLAEMGLPTDGIPAFERYAHLLVEKNKVMNLTAITEPADIGTGAGFPGMPLRILEPTVHMTLLDSLNKRIDFLKEVCADLGFDDVNCVHARAEEFAAEHRESFDVVTSRAVANLQVLTELCLPLVKVGGTFLSMKSVDSSDELYDAEHAIETLGGKVDRTVDYTIPGTNVSHRLIFIKKVRETDKKYPRPFAKIKKAPL